MFLEMRKTWLTIVAGIGISLLIAAAIAAILLPRLVNLENYRPQILSMAQTALQRPVAYQSAEFTWQPNPAIVCRGITIREKSSSSDFLTIDRLSLHLALFPLLNREVRLRRVVVERPVLMLERDRQGALNIDDLFRGPPVNFQLQLASLRVQNGLIRFTDYQVDAKGFTTVMEKLDLQLEDFARKKTASFKLSAIMPAAHGDAAVSIAGKVRLPGAAEPLATAKFDLFLSAEKLDPWHFWPYFGHKLPLERGSGNLAGSMKLKGGTDSFAATGEFRTSGLNLSYPAAFRKPLTAKTLQFVFDFERTPGDLLLKSFVLDIDGLQAKGSCSLADFREKNPRISARITTGPLRFAELNNYIPYGIIPKGTGNFIAEHIKGGVYRVEEGKLEGRLSQIMNPGSGDTNNALDIRVKVENGQLDFGPQIPLFSGISGNLLVRSRDFVLQGLAGSFGKSPFTLNGSIAGYSLAAPANYPFTMDIVPAASEVAWLLRQQPEALAFSGLSRLRLSGSGTVADYRLAGEWDLANAAYRYRQVLRKPAGTANRLQFNASFGGTEAQLAEIRYDLSPLSITASATYRYHGEEPLVFNAASNRFQAGQVLSLLPALQPYQPSGMLQAGISGSGNPAKPESIRLNGAIALEAFSIKPLAQFKPVSSIAGKIKLTEAALETEELSGKIGDSAFCIKGQISGRTNPTARLSFSAPQLHLEDFGLQSAAPVPVLKNLAGTISLKDGNLAVESLAGELNRTQFSASGAVASGTAPQISALIDFPYLRVEDMQSLAGLQRSGRVDDKSSDVALKARLTAAAGNAFGIAFERLDTTFAWQKKRLDLQLLRAAAFGGSVTASGQADFGNLGRPQYQARYRLDGVAADQLLLIAGYKPLFAGQLTATGDVAAAGNNNAELLESARASAELLLTDGALRLSGSSGNGTGGLPFQKAHSRFDYAGRVLKIGSVAVEALGGTAAINGAIDFNPADGPAYRSSFNIVGMEAADIFHEFDLSREISGKLTLKGELRSRGADRPALLKTLQGPVTAHLEKGTIRRYGVITKILSVLNVSQLLDFSLPDLVSTGMPYDTIDGSYTFGDGKVATSDWLLRSRSLNMTLVGSADLLNKELDVTAGVQPFQTVGRVISRIPIVGWLLAGDKKRIVVVSLAAKGAWDNPEVVITPITSLSSKVLGIFKRTLNLPGELVADPGKIMLGQ